MQLHELKVLRQSPLLLVEVRVDVVVPALATLLTDTPGQESGDLLPLLETVLGHLLLQDHVLLRGPVALDLLHSAVLRVVAQEQPPVHAVHGCLQLPLVLRVLIVLLGDPIVQESVNLADIFDLVYRHKLHQLFILLSRPDAGVVLRHGTYSHRGALAQWPHYLGLTALVHGVTVRRSLWVGDFLAKGRRVSSELVTNETAQRVLVAPRLPLVALLEQL